MFGQCANVSVGIVDAGLQFVRVRFGCEIVACGCVLVVLLFRIIIIVHWLVDRPI